LIMPKFRVFIEGRNFLIAGPHGEAKNGLYTARFLEASNPQAAEEMAIEQLRGTGVDLVPRGRQRGGARLIPPETT